MLGLFDGGGPAYGSSQRSWSEGRFGGEGGFVGVPLILVGEAPGVRLVCEAGEREAKGLILSA